VILIYIKTIATERPPPVDKVVPTFAGRGVSRGQRTGPHGRLSLFSRPGAAT